MKALALIMISSLFTINAMAAFNCSAQTKRDRNSVECSSSLLSDATKIAKNCPKQVKQNNNANGKVTY